VLGGAGQLGKSLVSSLDRTYDVQAYGHADLDICDGRRVEEVFRQEAPWAVINAAAWTDVDGCEKDIEKSYAINAIAAGHVARQGSCRGARVVHVSTDYVFDGFKESAYTEDDDPNPLSIYGRSKLEGERLVRQAAPDALIVRSSWLFGEGRANFVLRLFESVMVKTEIPIVADSYGCPTYTVDLADAIGLLLERDAKGLFHVTNKGSCSWYEFAVEILKTLEITTCKIVPIPSEQLKRLAPRPAHSILDNNKYLHFTGRHTRGWQEALSTFLGGLKEQDLIGGTL
jgi:dTDP-4-dehydrorhamnose reductase